MFLSDSSPASTNSSASECGSFSRVEAEISTPPGSAAPSRRAARLTESPNKSPSRTTSAAQIAPDDEPHSCAANPSVHRVSPRRCRVAVTASRSSTRPRKPSHSDIDTTLARRIHERTGVKAVGAAQRHTVPSPIRMPLDPVAESRPDRHMAAPFSSSARRISRGRSRRRQRPLPGVRDESTRHGGPKLPPASRCRNDRRSRSRPRRSRARRRQRR